MKSKPSCPAPLLALLILGMLAPLSSVLRAQTIPNPGFETNNLTNWTPTGSVSVVTAGAVADNGTIPEGTHVAALVCPGPVTQAKLSNTITGLVVGKKYYVICRVNSQESLAAVGAALAVQGISSTKQQQAVGGGAPYDTLAVAFTAVATTATVEVSALAVLSAGTLLVDDFRIVGTDVLNTANSGAGSLRQALADAAAAPGADVIGFDAALAGQTISLLSTIDINNTDGVTIDATGVPGIVIDDGVAQSYRLFSVQTTSKLTLRGLTLANGGGSSFAGGGGAIFADIDTVLVAERCTFSGNAVNGNNAIGGAVAAAGQATFMGCTFSGNSVTGTSSTGGALFCGLATITNCTFSGNFAAGTNARGGAIYFGDGASRITHCTIWGNSSTAFGGGIFNGTGGDAINLTNTIVAGNEALTDPNLNGNFNGSNSLTSGDPKLAPLADNGGPVKTLALLHGSPALDAGTVLNPVLPTDARGFARNLDSDGNGTAVPDIGAYEAQGTPVPSIGFNFNGASPRNLLPTDTAGAPGFAQTHWNNLSGDSETTQTARTLSGGTSTSLRTWYDGTGVFSFGSTDTPDRKLMSGFLFGPLDDNSGSNLSENKNKPFFALADLPATLTQGGYKVVVYADTDATSGRVLEYWLTTHADPLDVSGTTDLTPHLFLNDTANFDGTNYARLPATSTSSVGAATGNYLVFENQAQPGFILRTEGNGSFGPIINAVQVVRNELIAVTTTADELDPVGTPGTGVSLREALRDAPDGAGIIFAPALAGQTITLSAAVGEIRLEKNVTIDASNLQGGLTITTAAGSTARIFTVSAEKTVALAGLRLTGGKGGGQSLSSSGGAVANFGFLSLTDCTLTGNSASFDGNPNSGIGGAIYNGGTLTATGCTFASNKTDRVSNDPILDESAKGGAIYNAAGKSLALTNCTFSGNSSLNDGGAIASRGTVTITHCTVSGNFIGGNGLGGHGGGLAVNAGTLTLGHSVVAGNNANVGGTDIDKAASGATLVPVGVNLIGRNGTVATEFPQGTRVGTNASPVSANLAALANKGGPTQTMVPNLGSLAIDAASGSTATKDQRGFDRPKDGDGTGGAASDLGAVERGTFVPPIVINNTAESGAGSLRQAIADAGAVPDSQITFAPGFTGPIVLGTEITVPTNAVIAVDGSGVAGGLVITGGGANRLFTVHGGGTLALTGLTLSGGRTDFGGAISNFGTLTLTNCTLSGNSATNYGGAIENVGTLTLTNCTLSGNSAVGFGGAIINFDTLTLTNCTLSGNSTMGVGGAISSIGALTLGNTIVAGNSATTGADIFQDFELIIANGINLISDLAGSGLTDGPGVIVGAPNLSPLGHYGGPTRTMMPLLGSPAIDAGDNASVPVDAITDQRGTTRVFGGTVDIGAVERALFVTTTADSGAGSLRAAVASANLGDIINFEPSLSGQAINLASSIFLDKNLDITAEGLAAGATVNGGSQNFRLFTVPIGRTVTMRNLKLTNGGGTGFTEPGGAIFVPGTLNAIRCTFSGNRSTNDGGAITVDGGGVATLTESTLSSNTGKSGGAIFAGASGSVVLQRSTLNGNTASNGYGGAVFAQGSAVLTQCTVAGNTAAGTSANNGFGGGIYAEPGALTLLQSTIAGNTASGFGGTAFGGGVFVNGSPTGGYAIANTIITGNTAASGGPDLVENNFDQNTPFAFTGRIFLGSVNNTGFSAGPDVLTANAQLSALGDHGGPTQTMVPLAASPVRDKSNTTVNFGDALPTSFPTDQRGFARVAGSAADLGAVEAGNGLPLTNLALSAGTLTPAFTPATTSYTASVPNGTASLTVTPTGPGTITVNNTPVASGAASGAITLNVGQNTITTVVTGVDGATETYTVVVTRSAPPSNNANLSVLTLSEGTLNPAFASGTTSYTAHVFDTVPSITLTATRAEANATLAVRVNGGGFTALTSGSPSGALALNLGTNSIEVRVTAQDGTQKTYTVTVTRSANSPPQLTLPASPVIVNATSLSGAVVTFNVTASDAEDGALTPLVTPASGSLFPIGDTTVNVSATDSASATTNGSFVVTVMIGNPVSGVSLAANDPAPGAGGPSGLPADAVLTTVGGAVVSETGERGYLATWSSAGPPRRTGTGLFLEDQCLAVVGGDASGSVNSSRLAPMAAALVPAVRWKSFTAPVLHSGRLVTIAGIRGPSSSPTSAVLTYADGDAGLGTVASQGEIAPIADGTQPTGGAVFKKFKAVATHTGSIAIFAQLKAPAASDLGLWLKDGSGPLKLALREGQLITLPGESTPRRIKTLASFAGGDGSPGQGRGWLSIRDGSPAVLALAIFKDNTQAILSARGDGSFIALTATGYGNGVPGVSFKSFGLPAANDQIETVFTAKDSNGLRAIYMRTDLGTPTYVKLSQGAGGLQYSNFKDPVLAADGGIAYLTKGKPILLRWQPPGSTQVTVAQVGGDVADVPGAKWKAFNSLAIMNGGGPLFIGTLATKRGVVTEANAQGVWAVDSTGTLRLLFRAGVTQIGGKTVKSFSLLKATVGSMGVTRNFNEAGLVVWQATFSDKTTAIITTQVP